MFYFDEDSNESCFPNLSWKERILGFILCFLFGILIECLSFTSILGILVGLYRLIFQNLFYYSSPQKFAITFTLANLMLLIGLRAQFLQLI